MKEISSHAHKTLPCYLVGVLFEISDGHPRPFYMGVPFPESRARVSFQSVKCQKTNLQLLYILYIGEARLFSLYFSTHVKEKVSKANAKHARVVAGGELSEQEE